MITNCTVRARAAYDPTTSLGHWRQGGVRAVARSTRPHALRTASLHSPSTVDGEASPKPRLLLTLERKVGREAGVDEDLWQTGAFGAQVVPDLPPAVGLGQLIARWLHLPGAPRAPDREPAVRHAVNVTGNDDPPAHSGPAGTILVRSIAAQVYGLNTLQRHISAAVKGSGGYAPAQATMFVSGGHPLRGVPGVAPLLPDSTALLRWASGERAAGRLPAALRLWAVANPATDGLDRLERKVAAGATTLLTQPPLLWDRSRGWMERAAETGIPDRARIVMGLPLITSRANLRFWLFLVGAAAADPEARRLLESFPENGKDLPAVRAWNQNLACKTLELPGIGGLHVMPLTKTGRALVADLLEQGVVPRSIPGTQA